MSYIYDLEEGDIYKTIYPPLFCEKEISYGNSKPNSGASPPNPQADQLTESEKQYRLLREIFVDKLISAGHTLIKAKLLSLEKYPLKDFEIR